MCPKYTLAIPHITKYKLIYALVIAMNLMKIFQNK